MEHAREEYRLAGFLGAERDDTEAFENGSFDADRSGLGTVPLLRYGDSDDRDDHEDARRYADQVHGVTAFDSRLCRGRYRGGVGVTSVEALSAPGVLFGGGFF
ncbi:hypothetical protein [Cryptosporangium sp. NPDC051539]|uniref:hypothetical protein n=1 Tax=Cryptosporangium sp. NPDC051539 TaxID=3363962 RepID=UPI0037AE4EE9